MVIPSKQNLVENPRELCFYSSFNQKELSRIKQTQYRTRKNRTYALRMKGLKSSPECDCEYEKKPTTTHVTLKNVPIGCYRVARNYYLKLHNIFGKTDPRISGHNNLKKISSPYTLCTSRVLLSDYYYPDIVSRYYIFVVITVRIS